MRSLAFVIAAFALASCKEQAPRSVEWLKEHGAERKALIADCNRNAIPESVECLNAQKAEDALSLGRRGYVKPKPVTFD